MRSPHPVACRRRRFPRSIFVRGGRALRGSILPISSSHSSCTTRRISAKVGKGKSGWYKRRTSATRSTRNQGIGHAIDVTSRSIALNLAMYCSIRCICSLTNVPQLVIVKVDYISRIGFRPADQHRIGVFEVRRWAAEAMPSSICTRNTYRAMLRRSEARRNPSEDLTIGVPRVISYPPRSACSCSHLPRSISIHLVVVFSRSPIGPRAHASSGEMPSSARNRTSRHR